MAEPRTARTPVWLKRLGNRIRQVRRYRGLTQTDLAQPDLTKSFISLLESGRTYPSVGTLVALASRLQTSLALLLLEDSELPRETTLTLVSLARSLAGRNPDLVDHLLATAADLSAESNDLRAEIMLTRGDIAIAQGRTPDADRLLNEALSWAHRHRLKAHEPRILTRLASLAQQRGDVGAARTNLEEALGQFRATRTLRSIDGCDAMLAYADTLIEQGKPARALRALQDVARVAERQDLPSVLGRAHIGMARAHLQVGRGQEASDALRQAKSALEGVTESTDLTRTLRNLAALQTMAGHHQDAYASLQQAMRLVENLPDIRLRAAVVVDLARALAQVGRHDDAADAAKSALDLLRSHPDAYLRGQLLVTLARVSRAQKRGKQALDYFKEAVAIFKKGRRQVELAETARELGMFLKERGDHADAADYLAMAISVEKARAN
ncbi:MAG TPA: tetratricopeptide repeat protein [bacterium]|nr:tetratricopeptide repeat protein [bacterium]